MKICIHINLKNIFLLSIIKEINFFTYSLAAEEIMNEIVSRTEIQFLSIKKSQ